MENTKEHIINDAILSYFKDFSWEIIKETPNLEGWLYSNLLLSLESKTIIIQIKCNNDSNFENKLIKKELELDYTKPIIFLKLNPCHSNSSNPIESCWEKNIFGLYVLKQNRKQEWGNWVSELKSIIDYWVNPRNNTENDIEII